MSVPFSIKMHLENNLCQIFRWPNLVSVFFSIKIHQKNNLCQIFNWPNLVSVPFSIKIYLYNNLHQIFRSLNLVSVHFLITMWDLKQKIRSKKIIRICSHATSIDSMLGDSSYGRRSLTLLQFTSWRAVTIFTAWWQFWPRILLAYPDH